MDMQIKELKNGRLAMLAFSGVVTQAALGHPNFPAEPWAEGRAFATSRELGGGSRRRAAAIRSHPLAMSVRNMYDSTGSVCVACARPGTAPRPSSL
eukprot:3015471-Prymnesium_polylepis.1